MLPTHPTARKLAVKVPVVYSNMPNADVLDIFDSHRHLVSLPVLEGHQPIGLISRHIFMSEMSKPYYRELYEKKSCIAFMDKSPLIVEVDTPIETLAALAVDYGDKTLADGFLLVENGVFAGLGAGLDLMHALLDLQTEKNRQVMQSIDYASTIQRAMLEESSKTLTTTLADAHIIWDPRDIVGGDFYHFTTYSHGWFCAIADCTGHGVPGAFLTLIASSALSHALNQHGPTDPGLIMASVNRAIKQALGQHTANEVQGSNDGMDALFMWFDHTTHRLSSAHANMSLFVIEQNALSVATIKGSRTGAGYADTPSDYHWANQVNHMPPGTLICCSTDGLIDQIGGSKHIAYGKRRLCDSLLEQAHGSTRDVAQHVMQQLHIYQGTQRRRDDLTLLCLRIN